MAENNLLETGHMWNAKGNYFSGRSGLLTGTIVTGAGAGVFGLRNVGPEELVLSRLEMSFATIAAFAAPAPPSFSAYKVTGFSVNFAAGQTITPIRKRVTDHLILPPAVDPTISALPTAASCVVATTVALAGGTYVVDLNSPIDTLICDTAPVGATGFHQGESLWEPTNNIPFTLAPNEGIVVLVDTFVAGAGTGRLLVVCDTHLA